MFFKVVYPNTESIYDCVKYTRSAVREDGKPSYSQFMVELTDGSIREINVSEPAEVYIMSNDGKTIERYYKF